jgi:hypothetical protein
MPSTTPSEPHLIEAGEQTAASRLTGQKRAEQVIPLLIFLFSVAYLCMFRRYTSLEPDEGIVLVGAERILRGEVPYRDFFSFYTPGSFYLVALVFRIFDDSLVVARISLAIAGAACSVVTYLLSRRVCPRGVSLFAAGLATIAGLPYRFLVLHNWYSTALACLALYTAVRLLETRKAAWAFAVGSLASMTILFEQSKGAGLCLGLALGFLTLWTVGRESVPSRLESLGLFSGLAWPFFLTFAYFGAQHASGIMVQDWLWPLHHYTQANRVPYGYQNWSDTVRDTIFHSGPVWLRIVKVLLVSPGFVVPAVPLVAVGLLVYWTLQMRRRKAPSEKYGYYILTCSVLFGLLVSVLIVRADIIHFMYLAPLLYLALAWMVGSGDFDGQVLATMRPLLIAYVGVAFGLMGWVVLTTATGAKVQIETKRGAIRTRNKDKVIEYMQAHVVPGDKVFVYPYLPLYYYLTGTRSASRYDYFQPGLNTSDQAQEIITSFGSQNVRAVLFEPWFAEKFANSWPGTPWSAIANDPVADYIVRNYRVCRLLNSPAGWRFEYMVRKSESCP